MNLKNKRLLILGAAALHNKVVQAAKELGVYTIVTDHIPNSPAKKLADKSYDINVSDVDAVVAMCREERVEAVLSVCLDFCQIYYQQICERLQLPCWGSREQFAILTQKERFKQACQACGVDIIPTYSEADIVENRPEVAYPLLIKPSQNRGSRGIRVCHSQKEALAALSEAKVLSGDGKAIAEKYMGGKPDFQVTYLVTNGVPYVVRTADRYLGDREYGMDRIAVALSSPSKYTGLYYEKVHAKMVKLLRHIGLTNAPAFFQGFVDGETVRFYDPGLRFPGGDYDRIFSKVMNLDLMKSLVELAFVGEMPSVQNALGEKTAYLNGRVIFTLHSTVREGRIAYETPVEELTAIDGVLYATYRHAVGDRIGMTYDVNQRIAEINILGRDTADTVRIIKAVQEKLVVLDEAGQSMIFCPFDTKKLEAEENRHADH